MPTTIYYVPCEEPGCWVLFHTEEHVPFNSSCRFHGCAVRVIELRQGVVTEFEAEQGWTHQKPD